MTNELNALHYLFTPSNGAIAAHCLDLDIASSGRDLAEAEASLDRLIQFYLKQASARRKAPWSYWSALGQAKPLEPKYLEIDVPPHSLRVNRHDHGVTVLRAQSAQIAA
jgi:hypothetical protein